MESQEQLDTDQDFLRIDIKEEVIFDEIEDQSCTSEINEESVIIKEEEVCSEDYQSLTSNDLNDVNLDEDKEVVKKDEEEIDYVWSEASENEPDPLALLDVKYEDGTQISEEEETVASVGYTLTSSRKDSETLPIIEGYRCRVCKHIFSQISYLRKHVKIHTSERPYKCKECDYSSGVLRNLKSHMRVHTGERPFKCKECDYSAAQLNTLKTHMKRHTGERPYKCNECDYSAARLSTIKRHMRAHTGERPFKCKECKFTATQLSNLKSHIKTHIGKTNLDVVVQ